MPKLIPTNEFSVYKTQIVYTFVPTPLRIQRHPPERVEASYLASTMVTLYFEKSVTVFAQQGSESYVQISNLNEHADRVSIGTAFTYSLRTYDV